MVGPELGRETDAIAESAYTIEHRLCVTTRAHGINQVGWKIKSGPAKAGPAGPAAPPLSKWWLLSRN